MAKILTDQEWMAQEYKRKAHTPDVGRLANFFFTRAISSGVHRYKLAALQTLWATCPERFSISPIHSEDNHFSVRINYVRDSFETIHLNVIPNTNIIHSASFALKNGGETEFHILWQNLKVKNVSNE